MEVADVMTRDVTSIAPDDRLRHAATVMRDHDVGGLPVVEDKRVIGMITESDFLNLAAAEPGRGRHGILDLILGGQKTAPSTTLVREAMTKDPHTVTDDMPLRHAARKMKRHRVKRVPVVDDAGHLVGILSRSDVMKVFARDDRGIEADAGAILHRYRFDHQVQAEVNDGTIVLTGNVEHRSGAELVEAILRRLEGVIDLDNRVTWVYDDTADR